MVDTLETAPAADTHWSTRGLAAKHGISHQTVAEIWRAFGLKPWREDSFKVSPDPDLVEKIRDIVALYMNPPVAAVVFHWTSTSCSTTCPPTRPRPSTNGCSATAESNAGSAP